MRLLNIFNHYLEPGGEARAVEAITSSLSKFVDLERCDFFSSDWVGKNAPSPWKQALLTLRNPVSVARIREEQHRFKADAWLVHNVFPVGSAAIYSEAKRLNVPVIQYIHNFRPFSVNGYLWAGNRLAPEGLNRNYWPEIRAGAWRDSRVKTAWLAFALTVMHYRGAWRDVTTWVAVSEFMRRKFIEAGIPSEKIFALRHYWKSTERQVSAENKHYLFLGRLAEPKGVKVLLDCWQILERRCGRSTPRLLIGGDGPLRPFVQERAERMGSVSYPGVLTTDAKNGAIGTAKAIIVPSICWEALGLVVYEAYDRSRPVLAADSGGLSEIVIDSETGLVHRPGDAEQLADHVERLEREPDLGREMGVSGRRWLEGNTQESQWQQKFIHIAEHAIGS